MFVRIGQFKALPEKTEELRRVYEMEAIPAIRSAAGNVSAVLLQQHQSSECFLAITVWKTEQDAKTYDHSGQAARMVDKISAYSPKISHTLVASFSFTRRRPPRGSTS